jgi:hypothetical protein
MEAIAKQIVIAMNNQAIDVLYTKLDLLEEQYSTCNIPYIEYSFIKHDILMDIESILSLYLCPTDLSI